MRLAQGEQTQSPELSNHFTKMWVRKVNSSGCRERYEVIGGWESISEEIRQANLGCFSTSKTGMTQLYFVITEWKTLKRENNIYVKTQYRHRTNGCKSVIYQPRLATSTRTQELVVQRDSCQAYYTRRSQTSWLKKSNLVFLNFNIDKCCTYFWYLQDICFFFFFWNNEMPKYFT